MTKKPTAVQQLEKSKRECKKDLLIHLDELLEAHNLINYTLAEYRYLNDLTGTALHSVYHEMAQVDQCINRLHTAVRRVLDAETTS